MVRVRIKHRSNGRGQLVKAERETTQDIVATYMDGRVRTSGGDIWRVIQKAANYWETVA